MPTILPSPRRLSIGPRQGCRPTKVGAWARPRTAAARRTTRHTDRMERPAPDTVQPPVTRWGVFFRLVGVLAISTIGLLSVPDHRHGAWLAVDVVLGLVALVLV